MNIRQFVEEKTKHFDQKLNSLAIAMRMLEAVKNTEGHTADQLNKHNENCNARYAEALDEYKDSLRELIGEVRREVEKLRPEKCDCTDEKGGYECEHWGAHEALDSMLHLLDEAGGGK